MVRPSSAKSVYLIPDEDDHLEGQIRKLLESAEVLVQPLRYHAETARDLRSVDKDEDLKTFLTTSDAVVVLNGKFKKVDERRVSKVSSRVHYHYREIGRPPVIGIVDGPDDPRLEPARPLRVFQAENPDLLRQMLAWLETTAGFPAPSAA